jgi:anthranilate synthase component 2
MKVLIVDNNDSFTYNLKQLLENSGLYSYKVIKSEELSIHEVEKYDKIIISPGPGLPEEIPLLHEIIIRYHTTTPILGVCLGFQAIVNAFGGELYNMKQPYHGIKKKIRIINDDILFQNIGTETEVGLYHSWAAKSENFPDELIITSKSEEGIIMSLKHKHTNLRGIQFHPESIITSQGQLMLNNWLNYRD